jgi:hypothetical protein
MRMSSTAPCDTPARRRIYAAIEQRLRSDFAAACFEGGQSTNYRINKLVLQEALAERTVELWFEAADAIDVVEAAVIERLKSTWNHAHPRG